MTVSKRGCQIRAGVYNECILSSSWKAKLDYKIEDQYDEKYRHVSINSLITKTHPMITNLSYD